jgi:hypothetical protein
MENHYVSPLQLLSWRNAIGMTFWSEGMFARIFHKEISQMIQDLDKKRDGFVSKYQGYVPSNLVRTKTEESQRLVSNLR